MYDWMDLEAARLHRRELLREAAEVRQTKETGNRGGRRTPLGLVVRWELDRGLGRAGKLLRRLSPRG